MHRVSRRHHSLQGLLRLLLLLLLSWATISSTAATSSIGFDAAFTSATSPYSVNECNTSCTSPSSITFQLRLVRTGSLSTTDTVYVSTRPSGDPSRLEATASTDYTPLSNVPVVFAPSENTKTVTTTVISDGVYEDDEYFEAVLDSPSDGVTLIELSNVAYIKIQDGGDAGIFAFSLNTYTFAEDAGTVQVKVVRSGGANGVVKVTYRIANPLQSTAFNTKSFQLTDSIYELTFAENQREALIPIRIIDDAVYESNEYFYLELSALWPMRTRDTSTSVAKYGTPRMAVVFIADDGDAGQFDFAAPHIFCREDNGSAVVSIVRSLGLSSSSYTPVMLSVTTVGSNATEGGSLAFDYTATSDKLEWANGETRKTFAVKIFNNNRYEPDSRAFKIRMTAVEGGASISSQAEIWVYIVDDRDAGTLSFKQANYKVLENAGTVTVEITRSGLSDASAINTYTSGVVSVDVLTYAGTIVPGKDKYDLDYDYDVVNSRQCTHVSPCIAVEGVAYTALPPTTLTFADGEASKTVVIPILDDTLYEAPDQVFKVLLRNVGGGAHIGIDYEHPTEWIGYRSEFLALDKRRAGLADNVGTIVTIQDDKDPAVLVSKMSLSLSEIGHHDSFDVWLNAAPTATVTVALACDASVLILSVATLTFTTTDWETRQSVRVTAVTNRRTQALPQSAITLTVTSSDPAYTGPLRTSLAPMTLSFVVGAKIYTQKPGDYDTGNLLHAFPWSEVSGVLTSPAASATITAFILDDDPAGVVVSPESVRHQSASSLMPLNHVGVRKDGHNAAVGISLASQPAGDVQLTVVTGVGHGLRVDPSTLTFTSANWDTAQSITIVAVASLTTTLEDVVHYSDVKVITSSAADPFYNKPNEAMETIHVARYPPARVVFDASVLQTRENDDAAAASYEMQLGSEPMHWEPEGSRQYKPLENVLSASADTTLTLSHDTAIALAATGTQSTFAAASNSSSSSPTSHHTKIGVVRFTVYPSITTTTGSHQVGAAKLRLYRLSGGENGGLGGISVGVAIVSGSLSETWDENTLCSVCAMDANSKIQCTLRNAAHTSLPLSSLFPPKSSFLNISTLSAGATTLTPTGVFDAVTNTYPPTPGWVEIDVTIALNAFLAQQHQLEQAQQPFSRELSFLVYTAAPSSSFFVYDGVSEVTFASRDHSDASLRPQLSVLGSGRINLALAPATSVSQSHPGSARAAVDGRTTSTLGVASSFAMSSTAYNYPWWHADLGVLRLVDEVVVTVKRKASSAAIKPSQLPVSLWLMLSDTMPLSTNNNNGIAGWTHAHYNARFRKQFNLSTRSFTAAEEDNIVLRWRVFGAQGDASFDQDHFRADFSATVEVRYLLLQVEGENAIALNEVEIFQPALASAKVLVGGYIPSPSTTRKPKNQIAFHLNQADTSPEGDECDPATAVCRHELLFTSGDWWQPKTIHVRVFDDDVATGDRDILLTHTVKSGDTAFQGTAVCDAVPTAASDPCLPALFSESGVKVLRVHDDDNNTVVFATSELEIEEGSGVYPNAPVTRQARRVFPSSVRCSDAPTAVVSVGQSGGVSSSCGVVFSNTTTATTPTTTASWETCIVDPAATTLSSGSAWLMAGFAQSDLIVTEISLRIPKMQNTKYVRQLTLWWSSSLDINTTSAATLLDITNSWTKITSYDIAMTSSGVQTVKAPDLELVSPTVLLIAFDKSYDEATHCLIAPSVEIRASVAVLFPLATRGDLLNVDSVAPRDSGRSRMHQHGRVAKLHVRLASEPVADVVVGVVIDPANAAVSVYDAANKSASPSVLLLTGGSYESGDTRTFKAPTALRFTPTNWNVAQELTFLAVDDNTFNGNRTFGIAHSVTSTDASASAIPTQSYTNNAITRSFTMVPPEYAYGAALFVVSNARDPSWPKRWIPQSFLGNGVVHVTVLDDDLPGVTLSTSTVVVSESAGEPGNYSLALDSAPSGDVVVAITYELDDSLLTVDPMQLTFTRTNWKTPQFVFIRPVPNHVNDAGAPLAIGYNRLVAKKSQPLLKHKVTSTADAVYNGMIIGGNEFDMNTAYAVNQGVTAIVQDDDTGCPLEYVCQNGGVCVNITYDGSDQHSASVCKCPATYGMKSCSAVCANARDCAFSRVEFRLKCRPGDATAVCGDVFSPSKFVATLYRMVTTTTLVSSNGKTHEKLSLGAMADVLYIVNSTEVACSEATSSSAATCVAVVMDVSKATGLTTNAIVDKLQGYLETGSLQAHPLFAELMSTTQQYPQSIAATVVVWVFLGFCLACIGVVGWLFSMRYIQSKKSQSLVQPQNDDDPMATEDAGLLDGKPHVQAH